MQMKSLLIDRIVRKQIPKGTKTIVASSKSIQKDFEIGKGEIVCFVSEGKVKTQQIMKFLRGEKVSKSGVWQFGGNVAFFSADTWFYNDHQTLLENIILGNVLNHSRLEEVLFLSELPLATSKVFGGLMMEGDKISQGDRKKISFARLFYSQNDIYVFGGFFDDYSVNKEQRLLKLSSVLHNKLIKDKTRIYISSIDELCEKADLLLSLKNDDLQIIAFQPNIKTTIRERIELDTEDKPNYEQ